ELGVGRVPDARGGPLGGRDQAAVRGEGGVGDGVAVGLDSGPGGGEGAFGGVPETELGGARGSEQAVAGRESQDRVLVLVAEVGRGEGGGVPRAQPPVERRGDRSTVGREGDVPAGRRG